MSDLPVQSINDDDLLVSVSHELRSPLSNICTYSDMILDEAKGLTNSQIQQDTQRIQVQAKRLLTVVDDILELVRAITLQRARFDLSLPIEEALARVHEAAEAARCILIRNIPPDLPLVEMDATAIAQVIAILLSHAIKFAEQDTVGISAYKDDAAVVICVSDGDAEERPQQANTTELPAKRIKGPLGIELLICKHLVERHEGSFWASRQNDGRSISLNFSLPTYSHNSQE